MNPGLVPASSELRAAAVLIGIVLRDEGPTILFTRRTAHLAVHAGQVSFPGGRIEDGETAIEAARRESEEEIALSHGSVEVLGTLDHYVTGTAFTVTPVVGLVTPPLDLRAAEDEVDEIFEVPLAFFLDPASRRTIEHEYQGIRRSTYAFTSGTHTIWGATAGMLVNLVEFLQS